MRKLILIAGHNRANPLKFTGRDPGAVLRDSSGSEITNEHYECEKLVQPVYEALKEKGLNVELCPFDIPLYSRWKEDKIEWCNERAGINDFIVSVHFNAFSDPKAHGTEIFYEEGSKRGRVEANRMRYLLTETMGTKGRGKDKGRKEDSETRHGRLGIIRDTSAEAFLFEMGFLTNEKDFAKVRNYGVQALQECCEYLLR